ncbi:MAG: mannosyltransferase [Actinomycetes bacterium]
MKYATKSIIIIAFISALFSFAKFDHCLNTNFATPDVYTHACYSDLPALFGARDLFNHAWPYSSASNSVEYPPITGVVMWLTALPIHGDKSYFLINVGLIALLFIGLSLLVAQMKPELWYLLPLSPAVIASLYINWDLWAVASAILAIYYFDRRKYDYSALALGLSIATKFFPIVLLVPIALIFYRRADIKGALRFGLVTAGSWLAINAPFILFNRSGWWRFFAMNKDRGADFGSLWYALNLFGITTTNLNLLSILLFLIGLATFAVYFFGLGELPSLATISFAVVAIFTISSKVYSPQYILWLTPLAILAMRGTKDRATFWIWQGAEILYHLAIWEYLASYSGSHFGLPAKAYAAATLIRIAATLVFLARVSTPAKAPQNLEFLISQTEGYA